MEGRFDDAPRERALAHVDDVAARRNAERVGRAIAGHVAEVSRRAAVHGLGARRDRCGHAKHAQEVAVCVKHLNASVGAIADIDVVVPVDRDAVRRAQLAGARAGLTPRHHPVAVHVVFGDARVYVSVADVDVAAGVEGQVRWLPKSPVLWGQRRILTLDRARALGARLRFAAEHPDDAAFGVHAHDHVRALVHRPDVVVGIDPEPVRERPRVEPSAVLTDEVARWAELEQLGGVNAVSRTAPCGIRAAVYENVTLRVDGHGRHLAEVHSVRKPEEVRYGLRGNLGSVLGTC